MKQVDIFGRKKWEKLSKKRNILFYYFQGALSGGSDNSLFQHLINLDKNKYCPIVIFNKSNNLLKELNKQKMKLVKQKFFARNFNLNFKKINFPGSNTFFYNFFLIIEVILIVKVIISQKIDLIHLNHNIKVDRPAAIAGLLTFRKVISHDRGLSKFTFFDRIVLKYVKNIICISNYVCEQYKSINIPKSKCTVVYNGIDINSFNNKNNTLSHELITIGFIGRLEQWKGIKTFIKAIPLVLEETKNVKFLILGEGNEKNTAQLLCKKLNISNFVSFLGNIKNVPEVLPNFDLFVHASIEPEPFGRVIIEAMASRVPVISTNIGGPKEIISDGVDGFLIVPDNPMELAKKINKIINDKNLLTNISKTAFVKVTTHFNIIDTTKYIEKVYGDNLI